MCFYISMMEPHFAIFTGKHLRWSLFLIKSQAFRPDSKRDSICEYCKVFKNIFFEEHL